MKILSAILGSLLFSTTVVADDAWLDAAIGGGLGGAVGAAIGNELGKRDGAIIGGAIGSAIGAALTTPKHKDRRTSGHHRHYRYSDDDYFDYRYSDYRDSDDDYYDSGYSDYWYPAGHRERRFCPPGLARQGRC